MSHRVFLFGTLKDGFPNFHINRGRRVAGEFVTVDAYPLYLVGERRSPWLLDAPGTGHRVRGQLFEVDDAGLADMDQLERAGEPDGYRRTAIAVRPEDEGAAEALCVFAYLKDASEFTRHAAGAIGPLPEYSAAHAALYRRREP